MFRIFHTSFCPFCIRVVQGLQHLGLVEGQDYELINAPHGSPGRAELLELGGRHQVPFLQHVDVLMYESEDILNYIRNQVAA